jgi:hypothetical protein
MEVADFEVVVVLPAFSLVLVLDFGDYELDDFE